MITLGISTSSGRFDLMLGKENEVIYNSNDSEEIIDIKDLSKLLHLGLERTNLKLNEINQIIVDIGPGGTSSVRTGVAFANSLSYSLNIPVCPVSSLELTGIDLWEQYKIPVISTVKSIKNNAFIAVFNDDFNFSITYGKIEKEVENLIKNIDEICIAGYHREQIKEKLSIKIIDTRLNYGNSEQLIKKQYLFTKRGIDFPKIAHPITEDNLIILI